MPEPSRLAAFCAASMALILVPGPNLVYIMTRSVAHGRRAGLVSACGVEAATLVHLTAATLGVSGLVARSELAFSAVKYAGAAYLVLLGVRALTASAGSTDLTADPGPARLWRIFREGALVNLLNPKVTLFFVALFPQFVDRDGGASATRAELLALGAVFLVLAVVMDVLYALAGGAVSGWLRRRPRVLGRQHLAVGTMYLCLGAAAALA